MLKEFSFEKKGYTFKLRNPKLDEHDRLMLEWKVEKECENAHGTDGYFYGGTFDEKNKRVICYSLKIKEKEYAGIVLPDNVFSELTEIDKLLREEREVLISRVVDEIIEGTRPIDFKIVGCDFPHYQPWLYSDLPKELNGLEQKIMGRAITKLTGEKYVFYPCDYLEKKLDIVIATKEELRKDAFNLIFDKKEQKYYGFNDDVVTSFQIKLIDLISDGDLEKIKLEKEKRKEKEKRRNALKMEIVNKGKEKGSDGDDFFAIVRLTDKETGESLLFNCRNIFDAGYCINPYYEIVPGVKGGIIKGGYWQDYKAEKGWHNVRKLTDFEKKCLDYLSEFPPIDTSIRL